MAYVPKPNTGTLWPNQYKKADNHPNIRGDLLIERGLLKLLMEKHTTPEGMVKVAIAGWHGNTKGQETVYLVASEPYVPKPKAAEPAPQPEDDQDVPF